MQKQCFKCKTIKPILEFYKHSRMADGHLNKCKECTKADVSKHRFENIEKVRHYDRNRANYSERLKASVELTRIWRAKDKRRQKAHSAVSNAIKSGKLIRQPCCRCGEKKSLAHHEDYDKPLDVMWLCQPCHTQRHKEIKTS
jgi:ribosomal protein S27AE